MFANWESFEESW